MTTNNSINNTLGNASATTLKLGDGGILDTNGNTLLSVEPVASAVNYMFLTNAITGTGPTFQAAGADSSISVVLGAKGAGQFILVSQSTSPLAMYSGTGAQHFAAFGFMNSANSQTITFPDGNFTVADASGLLTWTPVFTFATLGDLSVSYATKAGFYSRIGDIVFYRFALTFTPTFTTSSGAVQITGLPITSNATVNLAAAGVLICGTLPTFPTGATSVFCSVAASSTIVNPAGIGSGVANASFATTNFTSGVSATLNGSGWYFI